MNDPARILVVDDDESTRKTLTLVLSKKGFEVVTAATGQDALEEARERDFDLAFLDIRLPDLQGVDLIEPLRTAHPQIAVFLITGYASLETALQALNTGASGYITKPVNMDDLLARAREALDKQRLAEEKLRAEAALRDSERNLRDLVENLLDGVAIADENGRHIYVNAKFAEITGYSVDELLNMTGWDLTRPEDMESLIHRMKNRMAGANHTEDYERVFVRKDGTEVVTEMSTTTTLWQGARRPLAVVRDITDRLSLEAELRQAQKMEAVGRLAGGVAHDFNNMLTVILGYLDGALEKIDPANPLYHDIEQIEHAARRSSDLTRQLLAFSRKQTAVPGVIDLNEIVARQKKMLERLIGEDVHIDLQLADSVWDVRMDPSQIDQILANLAANARDAIAGVGAVSIETANVTADEVSWHHDEDCGDYVMLRFEDTGAGMNSETLAHIFEPFFTTKAVGQGTGLGLSTVYGIVEQNSGRIHVDSEVGVGTAVTICFPRFHDEVERIEEPAPAELTGGTETILVVEDEEQILGLAKRLLEQNGYTVLSAGTPERACALAEQYDGHIDLLLTDVVMPTMDGKELAARIGDMKPGVKTLFMSGYTSDIIADRGVVDEGVEFLPKPFAVDALAKKVREVLGG